MKELVELFERQVNYVLRQPGSKLLLALPRFVEFVANELRIAAVIDDFTIEYEGERIAYEQIDDEVVVDFERFWLLYVDWLCAVWSRTIDPARVTSAREACGHPSEISGLVAGTRKKGSRGVSHEIEPSRLDAVMSRVLPMMHACETNDSADEQMKFAFRRGLAELFGRSDCARRRREAIERTHPGAAWRRLAWTAERVCPEDPSQRIMTGDDDPEKALATCAEGFELSDAALGRQLIVPNGAFIDPRRGILERDLEILREEVVRRIGLHLSHRALLMRFKTKCERFLAADLRTKCVQKASRAEAVLTLAAAEYLFDHGLNPLFNSDIVSLRPDLFDSSLHHALYVEAKQYEDGKSPRTLIKKAAWQVWDTWNELDSQHKVAEAFLVVFRRGGPLLVFEGPARFHGRTLHPILVDIGPTSGRGSRQKEQPVQIAVVDLLPSTGDNRTAGMVKRRRPEKAG